MPRIACARAIRIGEPSAGIRHRALPPLRRSASTTRSGSCDPDRVHVGRREAQRRQPRDRRGDSTRGVDSGSLRSSPSSRCRRSRGRPRRSARAAHRACAPSPARAEVAGIRVLGHQPQGLLLAAPADHQIRMRPRDALRRIQRALELPDARPRTAPPPPPTSAGRSGSSPRAGGTARRRAGT